MSAEEFGGVGFAAGVVRGTRSFDIDKLGRFTGVSYKQVWTPGENKAVCRKRESVPTAGFVAGPAGATYTVTWSPVGGSNWFALDSSTQRTEPKRDWSDAILDTSPLTAKAAAEAAKRLDEERKEKERLEAERKARDTLTDCTHGFYGYYDGSNDYYKPGYVMAVIEGYGETVIGTRGFRCMKARIVAVRIPKHVPARLRALVLRNYPDIPVFESFKAMVAEFPPDDAGAGVSPDTDPEFWTRAI